ncbi:MAG: beta-glucosidase [Methylobacteriaceae bacterium]|nr:beta-glucosidase [Methylobacteriaceae bacterium]
MPSDLFASFFLGGFECSSHRRRDGRRLDLLRSTGHDRYAAADYAALHAHGIRAARDGLRWHLVETTPGRYDWSSALPMAKAARAAGVQVIWDLCHYGWPDDIDIWSGAFPDRFARFAGEAVRLLGEVAEAPLLVCPINEISFWAWAGGEIGAFAPGATDRAGELKRQLARAWIAAADAIKTALPATLFVSAEPAIHVDPGGRPDAAWHQAAEWKRLSQFEAIDLVTGRASPELGGNEAWLDVVGINFYPHNQWYYEGSTIPMGHHSYRPFSELIGEWQDRYARPLFIAETGAEGSGRASWLHYVCGEVRQAIAAGRRVEGLCIYPVVEYAGWDNDRHCETGLLSAPDEHGRRSVHKPLARELAAQAALFSGLRPSRARTLAARAA